MTLHILIVDPDKSAAHVTSAIIQRLAPAASLAIVRSLEEASAHIQQQQPDLLIMDPSPYRLAGTQFIQLLKQQYPAMHIFVITSAPSTALRAKIRDLGVDGYLEKPALLQPIAQGLRDVLRSAQPKLELQPSFG